jgi:hypothetical protein
VLDIYGRVQAAPQVSVVIPFRYGFSTIIQSPITNQNSYSSKPEVCSHVSWNGIRDESYADLILPPVPAISAIIRAGSNGLV